MMTVGRTLLGVSAFVDRLYGNVGREAVTLRVRLLAVVRDWGGEYVVSRCVDISVLFFVLH